MLLILATIVVDRHLDVISDVLIITDDIGNETVIMYVMSDLTAHHLVALGLKTVKSSCCLALLAHNTTYRCSWDYFRMPQTHPLDLDHQSAISVGRWPFTKPHQIEKDLQNAVCCIHISMYCGILAYTVPTVEYLIHRDIGF